MKQAWQDDYDRLQSEYMDLSEKIVALNNKLSPWQDILDQENLEPYVIMFVKDQIKDLTNQIAYYEGSLSQKMEEIRHHLGHGRRKNMPEEPIEVGQLE